MLEYLAYKKLTKHKARRAAAQEQQQQQQQASDALADASPAPAADDAAVLGPEDESFLQQVVAEADQLPPPPLPPRRYGPELDWRSDQEAGPSSAGGDEAGGAKSSKKPGRLALLFARPKKAEAGLQPGGPVTPAEGEREKTDLSRVLDRLNLSARNNKVVAAGSSDMLQSFAQVFKDLVNGVPTACDDLAKLLHDRDGALSRGFDKLPASLKKLVTQLPDKVTGSLAPELMAAAAASQGIKADASGGIAGTAKKILLPHNLAELVTKPGAIAGMLRAIVEVLKTRWPAFIGMNVLWSVALSRTSAFPPPNPPASPSPAQHSYQACCRRHGLLTAICHQSSSSFSGTATSGAARCASRARDWRPRPSTAATASRSCRMTLRSQLPKQPRPRIRPRKRTLPRSPSGRRPRERRARMGKCP